MYCKYTMKKFIEINRDAFLKEKEKLKIKTWMKWITLVLSFLCMRIFPYPMFFLLLFKNHVCLFSTGFWFDYGAVIYYAVDESITFHHSVVDF